MPNATVRSGIRSCSFVFIVGLFNLVVIKVTAVMALHSLILVTHVPYHEATVQIISQIAVARPATRESERTRHVWKLISKVKLIILHVCDLCRDLLFVVHDLLAQCTTFISSQQFKRPPPPRLVCILSQSGIWTLVSRPCWPKYRWQTPNVQGPKTI